MCRKRAPPQTTSSREPEVPRDLEYGSEYARRRFNIEDMTVRVVQCAACFRIVLLPAAERNKAQRTCRTKLDVQEPFGARRSSTCKNPLAQRADERCRPARWPGQS